MASSNHLCFNLNDKPPFFDLNNDPLLEDNHISLEVNFGHGIFFIICFLSYLFHYFSDLIWGTFFLISCLISYDYFMSIM